MENAIRVEDFGAVGDGLTPDHEAIQLAINKGIEVNKPIQFEAKTYLINEELAISDFVTLLGVPRVGAAGFAGHGDGRTLLKAGTSRRSIVAISGNRSVLMKDLVFDADRKASYAIYLMGCSNSTFERITVTGAKVDGVHLASANDSGAATINDRNVWHDLVATRNGMLYVTSALLNHYTTPSSNALVLSGQYQELVSATASVIAGSSTVNVSGVDLTSLGLRRGDPMRIGIDTNTRHLMIQDVLGPAELRVSQVLDLTEGSVPFAIGRGDGYHEVRHGDNNHHSFYGGLLRHNVGYAFAFDGLYGPTVIGHQIDFHPFWGVRFGSTGGGPVIGSRVTGLYFERIDRKPFLLRSTNNIGIYHPLDNAWGSDPVDYGGHPENNVSGLYVNAKGIKPISFLQNQLPSTLLQNGTVTGHLYLARSILQPVNDTGTTDALAPFVVMRPGVSDLTMIGTPTLRVADRFGKLIVLMNEGPASVTLQDDSVLSGSKLRLATSTYTMESYDTITLVCDGSYWIEIARTRTV